MRRSHTNQESEQSIGGRGKSRHRTWRLGGAGSMLGTEETGSWSIVREEDSGFKRKLEKSCRPRGVGISM